MERKEIILGLCIAIAAIAIIIIILNMALSYPEFKRQLKYINSEIQRTEGREKKHWKRRKRRLIIRFLRLK